MFSPDNPSPKNPIHRSCIHWLVVNVPGMDIAKGQEISEYFGPMPPKGSGLCRFVVLVYQQSDKIEYEEKKMDLNSADDHFNFDVEKFSQKYDMNEPFAGNVFLAEWDDYVAELMKALYNISD